ncbi:hypothetical protein BG003_002742 [Podila horticola]|nr:hypothetical protein BG003_002742 [Podila horticola]
MVKITFSFLSIAAVVASVVFATSCAQDTFEGFDSDYRGGSRDNKCLPIGNVKEYQTFEIRSMNLNTIISKERDDNIVMFQELELCVVSTDAECNPLYPTNCIYENVDYRFRVNGPIKGYLRVVGNEVEIVPHFSQASDLSLIHIPSEGHLRIGHRSRTGELQAFSARRAGHPIVIETALPEVSQLMELKKTSSRKGRFDFW